MIIISIKQYDPIIAILRSSLLTNTELASLIGTWTDDGGNTCTAIYPAYIDSIDNPVYPAITICMDESETIKDRPVFDGTLYYIHGWSKNGPDEVAYLYNLVVNALDSSENGRSSISGLAKCRKVNGKSPLYDSDTRTHYFMSEFSIIASKGLMNA